MASPKISKRVLTVKGVKSAKPGPNGREIPDAGLPGFYLNVQPSGHRSFTLRYRIGGRSRKWTLGSFPKLSLEEARKLAREATGDIARGKDPAAEKAAQRRPGSPSGTPRTIDELIEKFLEGYVKKQCRSTTAKAYERLLRKEVLSCWRARDATSIRRADIRLLLEGIVASDRPVLANRVLAIIAKLFSWAVSLELLETNPAAGVEKPANENARERALTDSELRLVLDAADRLPDRDRDYINVLLLTLTRRNETAEMTWSEVNLAERVWVIPGMRTKNKSAHPVQLPDAVMEILEARPKDGPYVFPNARGGAFADFSRLKRELDRLIEEANGAPIPQWGLHDFRRSGVSVMPRLGVDVVTADKILNHKSGTLKGVAAVYQRYDFATEARQALEAWAAHLVRIRSDNIIELRRAQS
jgi:integrase